MSISYADFNIPSMFRTICTSTEKEGIEFLSKEGEVVFKGLDPVGNTVMFWKHKKDKTLMIVSIMNMDNFCIAVFVHSLEAVLPGQPI